MGLATSIVAGSEELVEAEIAKADGTKVCLKATSCQQPCLYLNIFAYCTSI